MDGTTNGSFESFVGATRHQRHSSTYRSTVIRPAGARGF
ncbi:hypothetical protein BURCENBC7_AP0058 [Burkholderia cenocepacia BC7]|nr:hypothetical protein BURCENBC7_AP0058 [Burkholderia cenocepacia BC7]